MLYHLELFLVVLVHHHDHVHCSVIFAVRLGTATIIFRFPTMTSLVVALMPKYTPSSPIHLELHK